MEGGYCNAKQNRLVLHKLYDNWTLWAHLPHDTDWTVKSYKKISTIHTMEDIISLMQHMPETLIKNCMLFIMRENILPMWEHPKNKNGGCFSFKINNKNINHAWENLSYILTGESLLKNKKDFKKINGITVSPKKNFCIIKIWMEDASIQNPTVLTEVPGLNIHGCLFKKHT